MAKPSIRRSITLTAEMRAQLTQILSGRSPEVTEVDLIREAIRHYIDQQTDVIGSRRHFYKSMKARMDQIEANLGFQMHIVTALITFLMEDDQGKAINEAIVYARRNRDILDARIAAVRDLEDPT